MPLPRSPLPGGPTFWDGGWCEGGGHTPCPLLWHSTDVSRHSDKSVFVFLGTGGTSTGAWRLVLAQNCKHTFHFQQNKN